MSLRGEGGHRELAESSMFATGRLSPDRSTIFDTSMWPAAAVAYDAETGRQRRIDAPWQHFTLAGRSDEDTFYGAAERIDYDRVENALRARQVITTESDGQRRLSVFLLEGGSSQL